MRYRVHRFDIDMTKDQRKLEQFLNSLEGEVVAIIPSVNPKFTVRGAGATVYFLLVVKRVSKTQNRLSTFLFFYFIFCYDYVDCYGITGLSQ